MRDGWMAAGLCCDFSTMRCVCISHKLIYIDNTVPPPKKNKILDAEMTPPSLGDIGRAGGMRALKTMGANFTVRYNFTTQVSERLCLHSNKKTGRTGRPTEQAYKTKGPTDPITIITQITITTITHPQNQRCLPWTATGGRTGRRASRRSTGPRRSGESRAWMYTYIYIIYIIIYIIYIKYICVCVCIRRGGVEVYLKLDG